MTTATLDARIETRGRSADPTAVVLAACQALLAEGRYPSVDVLYRRVCTERIGRERAALIRDRLIAEGQIPVDERHSQAQREWYAEHRARAAAKRRIAGAAEIEQLEAALAKVPKNPVDGLTEEHQCEAALCRLENLRERSDKSLADLRSSNTFAPPSKAPDAAAVARKAIQEYRAAWRSIFSSPKAEESPDGDRDRADGRHDAEHPRRGARVRGAREPQTNVRN